MPNGDPFASPTEWIRIKAFFQELFPILSSFAARHNLAIDEYYYESASWTFRFQHPKGGAGGILMSLLFQVTINSEQMLKFIDVPRPTDSNRGIVDALHMINSPLSKAERI